MNYNEVKDSGERTHFETGAKRDLSQGRGRYDLLPFIVLERLARHYENGASKYEDRNWEQGIPLRSYLDSTLRHITRWSQGSNDEDHLAAVLWNVAGLIWTIDKIEKGQRSRDLVKGLPEEVRNRLESTFAYKSEKTKINTGE